MPRQTEPSANNALRDILRRMLPGCEIHSETSRILRDYPGKRPDVLITASDRAPIVIEAEYEPAAQVEDDAAARLAQPISGQSRRVEAAIALKYPDEIADAYDLHAAISNARLSYSVLYADGARFPASGWLHGNPADIADLTRLVSIPQREVDAAAQTLEFGIGRAAGVMRDMTETAPVPLADIAQLLGMENGPQTHRMACAIIANALIFQDRIADLHPGVKRAQLTCATADPQRETLAAWREILDVNYYPVFIIGIDILNNMGSYHAAQILRLLAHTASEVNAAGAANSRDLVGLIFQRLISDRKYLATFYTLPASAALLARLAVAKLKGVNWADPRAIGRLRAADFACGTGTLLAAVYDQFASRHERAGGDAGNLHIAMMEDALYGCDVMPSAVHITGATLSGMQPRIGYSNSRLYTLAYGRQDDGDVKIGSLELLRSGAAMTLFNTSDPAMRTGSVGEETAAQIVADIPDGSFDIVIMNPPFTSNTKHRDADGNVLNAAFAAFGASIEDQDDMAARLIRLARGSYYHGHAGLGSAFASIAHKKVKPGGVIAFVLPLTAVNGSSWAKFRELIATEYTDVTVVSIAANDTDMSFSSDTGIAECLIIARKLESDEKPSMRARFVSAARRPFDLAQAHILTNGVLAVDSARTLEGGPFGGVIAHAGDDRAAEILDAPTDGYRTGWGAARIHDASVAQTAYSLSNGSLQLPGTHRALDLPMALLGEIGRRGLDSQMFISEAHNGPFTKTPPMPNATYPALWNHNARNETRIVCEPDSQLMVRIGMEGRVGQVWDTASHCHINREFTFGSQALAVAFTERVSAGGTAWPNVIFNDARFDYAFAVWGNSTLGLLMHWWRSTRQQSSKAAITIRSAETLPTLDLRALTDAQLAAARDIFDDFRDRELQPAYIADADPNRALLDRRVVCDMLGFDQSVYAAVRGLAAKWCAEPSVHGGKPRPKGVKFEV